MTHSKLRKSCEQTLFKELQTSGKKLKKVSVLGVMENQRKIASEIPF